MEFSKDTLHKLEHSQELLCKANDNMRNCINDFMKEQSANGYNYIGFERLIGVNDEYGIKSYIVGLAFDVEKDKCYVLEQTEYGYIYEDGINNNIDTENLSEFTANDLSEIIVSILDDAYISYTNKDDVLK